MGVEGVVFFFWGGGGGLSVLAKGSGWEGVECASKGLWGSMTCG